MASALHGIDKVNTSALWFEGSILLVDTVLALVHVGATVIYVRLAQIAVEAGAVTVAVVAVLVVTRLVVDTGGIVHALAAVLALWIFVVATVAEACVLARRASESIRAGANEDDSAVLWSSVLLACAAVLAGITGAHVVGRRDSASHAEPLRCTRAIETVLGNPCVVGRVRARALVFAWVRRALIKILVTHGACPAWGAVATKVVAVCWRACSVILTRFTIADRG